MVTNVTALGADVCKNRIVCWLLHDCPDDPRQFYKDNRRKINKDDSLTFAADARGIHDLIQLLKSQDNPALVLEPSGIHYAKLFAVIAEREGIMIRWVAHDKVKQLRKLEGIKDKNDQVDAFLLALYALRYRRKLDAFVRFEPGKIARIREIGFQLKALKRIKQPIQSRLKQHLAFEFPEVALKTSNPSKIDGLPPLYAWIAGIERGEGAKGNNLYDRVRERSIAVEYGIQIADFSKFLATGVCDIYRQDYKMLEELSGLLFSDEFVPYLEVFDRFAFGVKTAAVVLGQIYPFENFSSLEQFKSRLGFGVVDDSSGDSNKRKRERTAKHPRTALVSWVFAQVVKARPKVGGQEFAKVCAFYDRRMMEYCDNPLQLEYRDGQSYIQKQRRLIESMRRKNYNDIVISQLEMQTDLFEQKMNMLIADNQSLKDMLKGVRFGKDYKILVQNQTAARATQYLYWALKARFK
jgi:hypothetical protein